MKKELGIVIASFRKARKFKQDYIAVKLGISTQAYANIERGRSDLSSEKLIAVASVFGLKTHQLIVLAEEIMDAGETEWLDDAVRSLIRIAAPK